MSRDDYSIPQTGVAVIHFLAVSDQDRSSEFYRSAFGATGALDAIGSSRACGRPIGGHELSSTGQTNYRT